MKRYCYPGIFIFSFMLSISSYCQPSTHADDLHYYSTIALQMKDITPKVYAFWGGLKQGVMTATENGNHKLDAFSINDLKSDLRNNINDLDRKIRMIGSLDETDKDLNLKQFTIDYLTDTKSLEETSIPKVIQCLEKGIDKLTEPEKQSVKMFMLKTEELQKRSRSLKSLSLTYQAKHNITNAELEKYGL